MRTALQHALLPSPLAGAASAAYSTHSHRLAKDAKAKTAPSGQAGMEVVRNVGIMAHIDAGKTTTTERMLFYSGKVLRMGDVHDGDTVMDYLPQERARGITINSAAISFGWRGHAINLIDTPGHVDFTLEVERSVRVLDGAVTLLDAVAGVQAQTETVWHQATRYNVPRIAYVNKMDREGASFERAYKSLEDKLGVTPLPLQLPLGEAADFYGVVDLVQQQVLAWTLGSDGREYTATPLDQAGLPASMVAQAKIAREQLVSSISDFDMEFLEALDEASGNVSGDAVVAALQRIVRQPALGAVPVLCGSAYKKRAVQPLLDAVVDYLPSPAAAPPVRGKRVKDGSEVEIKPSVDAPLSALVFKVQQHPMRGPLCFFRVYSGVLRAKLPILNTSKNVKERVNKLLLVEADDYLDVEEVPAGNIGAVVGLKSACTGDTLCLAGDPNAVVLPTVNLPIPVFSAALELDSVSQQQALEEALQVLCREDPSLSVTTDTETGQQLLSGMGELHLEIALDKLQTEHKVPVTYGKMRVAYRESVQMAAAAQHNYDRVLGGQQHSVSMQVHIAPSEDGQNHVVVPNPLTVVTATSTGDAVVEVPFDTRLVVEEAVKAALHRGPLLGYPYHGVTVTVPAGACRFNENSTPAAIRAAIVYAMKDAATEAGPRLLEPYMQVEVVTPDRAMGDVLNDLTAQRRARVQDVASEPGLGERSRIVVQVPLSAMIGYATQIRSMTRGEGSFSMEFAEYHAVDANTQESLLTNPP